MSSKDCAAMVRIRRKGKVTPYGVDDTAPNLRSDERKQERKRKNTEVDCLSCCCCLCLLSCFTFRAPEFLAPIPNSSLMLKGTLGFHSYPIQSMTIAILFAV